MMLPKIMVLKLLQFLYLFIGLDYISGLKIDKISKIRLGSKDGRWVIPKNYLNNKSVCYLFGCGENISFDIALINKYQCNVYAFDPTPRAINYVKGKAKGMPNYHFSEIGLWDKKKVIKFFKPKNTKHVSHSILNLQKTSEYLYIHVDTLKNIMRQNGHKSIDLLKLDIEGAEYKVIDHIIKNNIKIKILCIEFDEFFNPLDYRYENRIKKYLEKITQFGFVLINSDGNGNYTLINNDII